VGNNLEVSTFKVRNDARCKSRGMDYDIRNSTTPISTSSYNTGEEDITWKTPIASRNHMIMHEGTRTI